jgi:hypothetical protein
MTTPLDPTATPAQIIARINDIETRIDNAGIAQLPVAPPPPVDPPPTTTKALADPDVVDTLATTGSLSATGVGGSSTTSIPGGIVGADMASFAGKVSLRGAQSLVLVGAGCYGPNWKQYWGGSTGVVAQSTSSFAIDMTVTNSRYVEVQVFAYSQYPKVRGWVGGKRLSELAYYPTAFWGNGNTNTIKFDLGAASPTPTRVRLDGMEVAFGKIWVEPGGTISPAPALPRLMCGPGDSGTAGTQYNTAVELGTWQHYIGGYLNADCWNGGVSQTGPVSAPSPLHNYQQRAIDEVVPSKADGIIVYDWLNDKNGGITAANIGAAMGTTINTLATMPNNPVILVVGAPDPSGASTGTNAAGAPFIAIENAVRSAILGKAAFASPVTGNVWDKAGNLVLTGTGPWIAASEVSTLVGADGLHPTDKGHKRIARKVREAITYLPPFVAVFGS